MSSCNAIVPANQTGVGHHAAGTLYGLLKHDPATSWELVYSDLNWVRNNVPELLPRGRGFDVRRPTVVFWHLDATAHFAGGVQKSILGPFETTCPVINPANTFHQVKFVGTFSKWGIEQLSKIFPAERLFMLPYAFYTKELVGLFTKISREGIELELNQTFPQEPDYELSFVTIGKPEFRKGFDLVIQALPKLGASSITTWFGLDAGVGPTWNLIASFAQSFGYRPIDYSYAGSPERALFHSKSGTLIIFPPFQPQTSTMWKRAREAQFYLAPSRGEGWGLGQFEAVAQGFKVIGTSVQAQAEYITSETAVIINNQGPTTPAIDPIIKYCYPAPPGQTPYFYTVQPEDLVVAIREAVGIDGEGWQKKQLAGINLAASYTWEDVGKRLKSAVTCPEDLLPDSFRSWNYA